MFVKSFKESFKAGLGVIAHPGKATDKKMSIKEALLAYYKFSVVPIALTILVSIVVMLTLPGVLAKAPTSYLVNGSVQLTLEVYKQYLISLVLTPLFIPVVLLVVAGMLHAVGKGLRLFNGSFASTLAAVVYAEFSSLLFWFTIALGALGSIIYLIALIYGIYVLVVGLSKQHGTSMTNAFVAGLIVFVILAVILSAYASAYVASLHAPA